MYNVRGIKIVNFTVPLVYQLQQNLFHSLKEVHDDQSHFSKKTKKT